MSAKSNIERAIETSTPNVGQLAGQQNASKYRPLVRALLPSVSDGASLATSNNMRIDIVGHSYIELPETIEWEETLLQLDAVEHSIFSFSGAPPQLIGLMALKRFVLMRIIQKDWNSKHKPVSIPRDIKSLVEANADFWLATIELLKQLDFPPGILSVSKFDLFKILFLEDVLTFDSAILLKPDKSKTETAVSIRKLMQSQNRALLALSNPFDRDSFPVTAAFTDRAIQLAERNDVFRKKYYNRMVRARERLTAFKIENNFRLEQSVAGRFVTSRQGRKKKAEQ
ncbi:MAG: hypothetical protein KME13_11360 [Myxacorys californica WJT36-NPBG1]|jgi:hypothetical protein|nr:hypothetical protein [Myxacorys californica WJT36-NPBG1]